MPSPEGIIWARWHLLEDGRVQVVATCEADSEYRQEKSVYDSLDDAADALGPGFRDVVARAIDAGSSSGRWRP